MRSFKKALTLIGTAAVALGAVSLVMAEGPEPIVRPNQMVAPNHPFVGSWVLAKTDANIDDGSCHEIMFMTTDGHRYVVAGQEVFTAIYEISPKPDAKGFYRMVDKLVDDNGKPDCHGKLNHPDRTKESAKEIFLRFAPDGESYEMCGDESGKCWGVTGRRQNHRTP